MNSNEVRFSVTTSAQWLPELDTNSSLNDMPVMLRRRASAPGKMALIAAYRCLREQHDIQSIPTLFCSRHGECGRSVSLLNDLVRDIPLSPMSFSLSTHNATSGLFSIARHDPSNNIAISSGKSTIEHAVIEACGLLADGAPAILLIAYDHQLPPIFNNYHDCDEQPYAFAWLIQRPTHECISLSWKPSQHNEDSDKNTAGTEIFEFFTRKHGPLERILNGQHWQWAHHS